MRRISQLKSSIWNKVSFNYGILNKKTRPLQFTQEQPQSLKVGVKHFYNLVVKANFYQYIPIYLLYYRKYSHVGINKFTNYLLYQKLTYLIQSQRRNPAKMETSKINQKKSSQQSEKQQEKEQAGKSKEESEEKEQQYKSYLFKSILAFIPLFILAYSGSQESEQTKRVNKQIYKQIPTQNIQQFIGAQLIAGKHLQNLKQIRIKQIKDRKDSFVISLVHPNGHQDKFLYIGNINNFQKMVQEYQRGRFQRTNIILQKKQLSLLDTLSDPLIFLTPFIGIAITIWIFTKINPDSIMSAISPKKNYKIQSVLNIKTKFNDVAGMEQAKQEITQFVDFLKYSQKYKDIGAKIPKGALLTGPPGTGKTLLAKATAGQADVPFFYISGSEFVEMFVGMGASKVRQLFSRARMQSPSIIFIDEIDAIGRKRQSSRNEQKDSTLNQLLVEMDGFGSNETVIVLAATNRKDTLDNALTRPGRFDRLVQVTLPQIKARQQIFKVHLKPLKIDPSKSLDAVAQRLSQLTPGFSGADIANLCNQAAIIAVRKGKKFVQDKDFEDAAERVTAGYQKKGLAKVQTRKRVAYHEAGHAIAGWFLRGGDPLVKLTIIPRSKGALGYAQYLPKSTYITTKSDLVDRIAIMLGGITSEQMHFDQISSGASDDLQKVYSLSRKMIAQFGMGLKTYNVTVDEGSHVRKESQSLSKKLDQQMMSLVKQAQDRCKEVLQSNKEVLSTLAQTLLQKQTINSEDIKEILGTRPKFQ